MNRSKRQQSEHVVDCSICQCSIDNDEVFVQCDASTRRTDTKKRHLYCAECFMATVDQQSRYRGRVRNDFDCLLCFPISRSFVTRWADTIDNKTPRNMTWSVCKLKCKRNTKVLSNVNDLADIVAAVMSNVPSTFDWKGLDRYDVSTMFRYFQSQRAQDSKTWAFCALSNHQSKSLPWCCGEWIKMQVYNI